MSSIRETAAWAALCLVVLAVSAIPPEAAEPVRLKLALAGRPGGLLSRQAGAIAAAVEEAGGGALAVTLVPAASGAVLFRDLENGDADLVLLDARDLGEAMPSLGILGYPFAFPSDSAATRFYRGRGGERVTVLLGQRRLTAAGWLAPLPLFLFSAKPIPDNGADSLRGLRLSAPARRSYAQGLSPLGVTLAPAAANNPLDALKSGAGAVELALADAAGLELPAGLAGATDVGHARQAVVLCHGVSVLANLPAGLADQFRQGLERGIAAADRVAENDASDAYGALSARGAELETRNSPELAVKAWEALKGNLNAADREVRELIQDGIDRLGIPETDAE